MTIKIDREDFLHTLEAIEPGLSPRDIIEQSSCIVFKEGEVITYNEEVCCRAKSEMTNGFAGAVKAAPLLAILRKLQEAKIEIDYTETELLVIGKRRRAGIQMEKEISLAVGVVEKPKKFKPIHEDFTDAVSIVQECAGKDEDKFALTCIHIHPEWIEACDNIQVTRYLMDTGVKKPVLVKRDALKHIVSLEMTEFSESETWMHFRNPDGIILSCRRFVEDYYDLGKFLQIKGEPMTLPKGLREAADKAEVFSSEDSDNNRVLIELRPGKLRIKGTGVSGWYSEVKGLKYSGRPMSFYIAPKLLMELVKRHNEVEITTDKLKVDGGKWTYITSLGTPDEAPDEEEK